MPPAPRGPGPWFLDFGLNTRVPFRFFHFYLVKNRIIEHEQLDLIELRSANINIVVVGVMCRRAPVTDQQVEACEKRMFLFIS